jgi:hypothetical protein
MGRLRSTSGPNAEESREVLGGIMAVEGRQEMQSLAPGMSIHIAKRLSLLPPDVCCHSLLHDFHLPYSSEL